MTDTFSLKIICPDGAKFEEQVQQLTVRSTTGEIGFLARHANCVAPLSMGRATVTADGTVRHAVCEGGMVCVMDGAVTLLPRRFEWASR